MAKKNNKGFGLIEIIIAIAVFVMLVVPIISQLATSMNLSKRSRTTQLTSEYGQYLMEYVKSVPLSDIGNDNLFDGDNKLQTKVSDHEETVSVNGVTVTYNAMSYEIKKADAVHLPGGLSTYYGDIALDTKAYALSKEGFRAATDAEKGDSNIAKYTGSDGVEYVSTAAKTDPNQVNVGNMTNLNTKVVAIIPGSTSNFDKTAADTIFTLKADMLKQDSEERWEQLMYGDSSFNDFDNDTVNKITTIKIRKSGGLNPTYTVSCELLYKDVPQSKYKVDDLKYNVYQQTFKGDEGVPKIYLMYNPCVYNGEYLAKDHIVLDVEGFDADDKVKLYLIETTSYLSDNIKQVMDDNSIPYTASLKQTEIDDPDNSGSKKTVHSLIDTNVNEAGMRVKRNNIITCFNAKGDYADKYEVYTNVALTNVNDYASFNSYSAPGKLNGDGTVDHKVKSLADDAEYKGRLYTVTVTLYDAKNDGVVGTYVGTRGAD